MIRKDELSRIARITGMRLHQQEKHYIQTLILRSVYSKFQPVFKGGTALMFTQGLNRFSEDLDFTLVRDIKIEELIETVTGDLRYLDIRSTYKIIKGTDASIAVRIGAQGPLFTREIERCYVRLELSKRMDMKHPPDTIFVDPMYPDIMPFSISIMESGEIAAEKIRAVMTRSKARDVYDLWFLVRKGVRVQRTLVDEKLGYYGMSFDHAIFEKKIESKRDIWGPELASFIIGPLPDFEDVALYLRSVDIG